MLVLKFSQTDSAVEEIIDRLREYALGHRTEEVAGLSLPVLEEGDSKWEGLPAIMGHLDELQGELKQWWYCDC